MEKASCMILVDINIFMDIFERRKGWVNSLEVINRVRQKENRGCISALSIPILWFLRSKFHTEENSKNDVQEIIKDFDIVALNETVIKKSFQSQMTDFEDALQLYSAVEAGCTRLITRNVADFTDNCNVAILTPEEFIKERV